MRFSKTKLSSVIFIGIIAQLLMAGSVLSAESELEDKQITGVIEAELWLDEAISSHLIDVETENGVVTLSGLVDNILEKERAVRIARCVKLDFGILSCCSK